MIKDNNNMNINNMSEEEEKNFETLIDRIAVKVVAKMVNLQSLVDWNKAMNTATIKDQVNDLALTEEEEDISDLAKFMTLMDLFTTNEQYEKCAVVKKILRRLNKKLKSDEY